MILDTTIDACNARRNEQNRLAQLAKSIDAMQLRARLEIYPYSAIISQFHASFINDNKIAYATSNETLNSYSDLLSEWESYGVIRVNSDNCDNTIFATPIENCLMRVVHDYLHCTYELPFNDDNDIYLGYEHIVLFIKWASENGLTNAQRNKCSQLLEIDIIEQSKYLRDNGVFVSNQLQFTLDILDNERAK